MYRRKAHSSAAWRHSQRLFSIFSDISLGHSELSLGIMAFYCVQVREGGVLVAFPNTDSSMEKMHLLAAEIMKVKHSNMITDRTLRCRKTRNYSWSLHLHSNLSISSNRNTLRYCEMTLLVWTVVPHVYDIKPTGCFPGLMTCMTRGASA